MTGLNPRSSPMLAFLFSLSFPMLAQRTPSPDRPAFEQQSKQVQAQRETLRAAAHQAFSSEMAREKAGDCPDAQTTYAFNVCFGQALTVTNRNLKAFEDAVRGVLSLKDPNLSGQPPGPAGPQLTPDQLAAEFDNLEKAWRAYLDAASTAAFHQFGGGTGGPSAEAECRLRLIRAHMRELNAIYDGPLNR